MSQPKKRSFVLGLPGKGRATSTSATDEQWDRLKAIAATRCVALSALLTEAADLPREGSLAQAALDHFGATGKEA